MVFVQGKGMGIYWAEWKLKGNSFEEVWTDPELINIPPCGRTAS